MARGQNTDGEGLGDKSDCGVWRRRVANRTVMGDDRDALVNDYPNL
jgi:hypothetical protein